MTLPTLDFVATRPSEECGCPEEEWIIGLINLTIHHDPDGRVHAFMDGGDWGEADTMFSGFFTLDAARATVFDWAASVLRGEA